MATQLAALKATAQDKVAPTPKTIFDLLTEPKARTAIASVAGRYMTPERFLRLAVNAIKKTPRLLECDPQTVLGSFMASAALALEPNTVLGQAYLIPYAVRGKLGNGQWGVTHYECQFQIGYRGFVTLAHRSPTVLSLKADAIHRGDHFDHLEGSRNFLEYRKALVERGDLIGAFAFSKLEGGAEAATVLTLEDIHKIRSKSETYQSLLRGMEKDGMQDWEKRKADQKFADTPWVLWEDDMAAKSAIKKHSKQLPMQPGEPMKAAQALDAADDGKTIDMSEFTDPDKLRQVMEDGEVISEGDEALAALEHQPGEVFDMGQQIGKQADKIDVRAFNEEQAAKTNRAAPAAEVTTGRDPGASDEDGAVAEVETELNAARTADALDLVADKIRSLPSTEQPRLNKLYRARHAEIENGGAKAPPRSAQRDPRQQSISME